MAKYAGLIGFMSYEETVPGVTTEKITERLYYGDVIKEAHKWSQAEKINDDIQIQNRLSIVADPYAFDNFFSIKYVTWNRVKWKVASVELQHPRLIMTLGGVYNG